MLLTEFIQIPCDLYQTEPSVVATFTCEFCGDDVPMYDKVNEVDGDLCSDCIAEYCKDKSNHADVVAGFIEQNQQAYYLDWYFNNLESSEKLALIKGMYAVHSMGIDCKKDSSFVEIEKEFCVDDDKFFDYIREGVF